MSKHLESAKRRERSAKRGEQRAAYVLTDAELARLIGATVRAEAPRFSESERDAIAQLVGERIARQWNRTRHGSPASVLAWIDRAERMPTFAARRELAERGNVGREFVRTCVARVIARDAHEWRDVANDYAKHRESERASAMVVSSDALTDAESGEPIGFLARAIDRESERNGTPMLARVDVDTDALAERLAESMDALTPGDRESVRTALLAGLPDAEGEPRKGPALAAYLGVSHGTIRNRVTRGRALWLAAYPTPADALAAVRLAAEALARESGEQSEQGSRLAPALSLAERAALSAAESAKREQGKRTHGYLCGSRIGYSPATARAARVRTGSGPLSPIGGAVIGCVAVDGRHPYARPLPMVDRIARKRAERAAAERLAYMRRQSAALAALRM